MDRSVETETERDMLVKLIREQQLPFTVSIVQGKHRSTAMAVELAGRLRANGIASRVLHRDLGKE